MKYTVHFYTVREGGTWLPWKEEWGYVTDKDLMKRNPSNNRIELVLVAGHIPPNHPVAVHALVIDDKRWDCINGWTGPIDMMEFYKGIE